MCFRPRSLGRTVPAGGIFGEIVWKPRVWKTAPKVTIFLENRCLPSKIKWDLTNGPLSKVLELLDTYIDFFDVFSQRACYPPGKDHISHLRKNENHRLQKCQTGWDTPWKIDILHLKSWWFGSDDFSDFNWVIFGFQPFIFQGVCDRCLEAGSCHRVFFRKNSVRKVERNPQTLGWSPTTPFLRVTWTHHPKKGHFESPGMYFSIFVI